MGGYTSFDGDLDQDLPDPEGSQGPDDSQGPEDPGSNDGGAYEQPGAYSNADGTVSFSGFGTGFDDGPDQFADDGNYPASVGAALAVGGLVVEALGAIVAGDLAAGGYISTNTAKAIDAVLFSGSRGAELIGEVSSPDE